MAESSRRPDARGPDMKTPDVVMGTAVGLFVATTIAVRSADAPKKAGDVSEARVLAEASSGANWLVGGRTFDEQHFSPLKQITDRNIGDLGFAWALDIDSAMGLSVEPIVVDGVIYVSAPQSRVRAVEAASGKVLWTFDPKVRLDRMRNSWSARTNRGVAVWAGKVYVGTGDCRLVAMDAASGRQVWESTVCDATQTGITGAPHAGNGRIFIGYNGSDTSVRGSVVAFDAETGKEAWRFWTVPGDPAKPFESTALEAAAKTWTGERSWDVGGGDVWDAITYDPATNLVLFGTAGANPSVLHGDFANLKVGGDRLFAGCIVAVKADTGEYVWHYQTSTRTENMHVMVADLAIDGATRRVAMTVPKNGVFYVLDVKTGALISSRRIDGREAPQPAAGGGRPQPGPSHNWWPMAYSPATGLVYIPAHDARPGDVAPGQPRSIGKLVAWDPVKQAARWSVEQPLDTNGGALATAGNLVFQGEATGEFAAYAADTGRKVWSVKTGSAIQSVPVSFNVGNDQYILMPVGLGSGSRLFGRVSNMGTPESKRGPARLLAFRLGTGKTMPETRVIVPPVPEPPPQKLDQATIERGRTLYGKFFCSDCHSPEADGSGAWVLDGAIPDLRYMPPAVHQQWNAIVLNGTRRRNGMPGFGEPAGFPLVTSRMTQEDGDAIHAYVIDLSWKAYNDEQAKSKK
jgi:quinohemoprotein ethanol dehydrogenase